uniref:Uncharacterized protein n=1 Tax=Ditylenchus dipsaci TaxID=166011 RepID=A0A915CQR5_9BILA
MFNAETRKLRIRHYMTRLASATVKHGSGFAQQAGDAMFLYPAIHVGLKFAIADDDLNSIAAAMAALLELVLQWSWFGIRATVKIEADCERWSISFELQEAEEKLKRDLRKLLLLSVP